MDTLVFPLIFNSNGLATIQDGTRDYYAQLLSNIATVQYGELPLRPDVGVPDVSFTITGSFVPLVSAAVRTLPEIVITSISEEAGVRGDTLGTTNIAIDFEVINAVT